MEQLQLRRLVTQLRRVYEKAPFYRRLFDEAGFDPYAIDSINDFRGKAPFVRKTDLISDQEKYPPFGTRLTVVPEEVCRFEITSGTSGLGQEVYGLTATDAATIGTMTAWTLSMSGIGPGDRLAVTLPLGYLQGPWGGHWGAEALGCPILHLGLAPDTASKLRYMQRFGVNALYTPTPTYLMRLTNVAVELGLDPRRDFPDFEVAWLAAEPYPVEWVERMREFWGITLVETYGSTQGAFAASCEYGLLHGAERGYLHNVDWNVLLEVVDPVTNEPVAPGETGEAVITTLVREASPVIRFRTGDLVRLMPDDCPCGRHTVSIEAGTIGRVDDMLKVKGMSIWPAAVDRTVLGSGEILEYVAEVGLDHRGYETVRLNVAFHSSLSSEARAERCVVLRKQLHALTNVTMDVVESKLEEMPTFEYKARRWVDRRKEQLATATVGAR